jgi:hypothetical protein
MPLMIANHSVAVLILIVELRYSVVGLLGPEICQTEGSYEAYSFDREYIEPRNC